MNTQKPYSAKTSKNTATPNKPPASKGNGLIRKSMNEGIRSDRKAK